MSKCLCALFLLFGLSASLKLQKRDDVWSSKASQGWQTVGKQWEVAESEKPQTEDLLDLMLATGEFDHRAAQGQRKYSADPKTIKTELEAALRISQETVRTGRVRSTAKGTYGLVWIHGAGFYNWKPLMDKYLEVQIPQSQVNLSITYPHSPVANVQAWGNTQGDSWYDMKFLPIGAKDQPPLYGCNLEDAQKNTAIVHESIKALELSGIPSEKIIVAGMSQGGYMTLRAALTYPKKLGGAFVYAGMLMDVDELKKSTVDVNANIPIEWLHGKNDDVLFHSMQTNGVQQLKAAGYTVEQTTCEAHHTSHPALYERLGMFMNKIMTA